MNTNICNKCIYYTFRFPILSQIAKLILTLPHSNASPERVFSVIRQNKTDSRNKLDPDETLGSLLTVKMYMPESSAPCYKFQPPKKVIEDSKKATWKYIQEHSS